MVLPAIPVGQSNGTVTNGVIVSVTF